MADVLRAPVYVQPFGRRFVAADAVPNLLQSTLAVAVAPAPFRQTDWQSPAIKRAVYAQQVVNQLTVGLPRNAFRQTDWTQAGRKATVQGFDPPNLLQSTLAGQVTAPFQPTELVQAIRARFVAQDQILNQLPLGLPCLPFNQTDWQPPQYLKRIQQQIPPNLIPLLALHGVTVPDVVGQTQAAGTSALQAVLFVVAVQTAYSSVVPAGLIISQVPVGGVDYPQGGTVTITVSLGEAPANTAAGSRKRRRRFIVEIDGQDFEVSSEDEAVALLASAREILVEEIEKARAAPIRIARGIQRPRIETASPELKPAVAQARRAINALYDEAIRDLEIQALMAQSFEEDEEETLIRFLM